ncbi:hypothetical protein B0H17DRAFT_1141066 [Mycena rosella]|uniref:Uncharacterized protein n=1 Tax=Mycena rosella TaxID=1033263 RepID=A0AAD7GB35_MYCRO|nr:hypothetical protein B0H17DRAFT_1141066 [Mycena rosella]
MELQERNQHNYNAEMANRTSIIRTTRKYEEDVLAGNAPPTTRDVSAKLIAFYAYHDAEVAKMRDSQQYCDQVVAPLPPKLIAFLLGEREKCAKEVEKKKEDEKAEKEKINPLTRPSVSTPQPFQAAIKYGLHPALFWFTDKHLRWATEHGSEIPMRKNTNVLAAPEKSLMDINKMNSTWGSDNSTDGHSILEPSTTLNLSMTSSTPSKKTLRNKVLDNNLAFDTPYWSSEVGGVLNAFKAQRNSSKGLLASQAVKMSDLGPSTASQTTAHIKPQRREDNYRPACELPTGLQNWTPHDSFRGNSSFRERGTEQARNSDSRERRPLVCLICTGNHTVQRHKEFKGPQKDFNDRQPFSSFYKDGQLKSVRNNQAICIGWNCNQPSKPCKGTAAHPSKRLHVCSLCGGGHPALPGDPRCPRFCNGTFAP